MTQTLFDGLIVSLGIYIFLFTLSTNETTTHPYY